MTVFESVNKALTRRLLLRGAAAVPLAALPIALPVAASAMPEENPALVAIGEEIAPRLKSYRTAVEQHRAALALAQSLCPAIPEELVLKKADMYTFSGCTDVEQDAEGKHVYPPNIIVDGRVRGVSPRLILKSALLKERMVKYGISSRTKLGRRIKALIVTAEKYEAEFAAAVERSGITTASDDRSFAADQVQSLAFRVRETDAVTMAGVIILARVGAAFDEVRPHAGYCGDVLSPILSRALIRVAGSTQSV